MCLFSKKSVLFLSRKRAFVSNNAFSNNPRRFEEIPGPLSLPVVGTLYQYLPLIGRYRFDRLSKNGLLNYHLYGPIIREEIAPGQSIVWLVDPQDIETMYRTEGAYPNRRSHLALQKYRLDKPHVYNTGGLLPTNGAEWARLRKVFQKGLSGPKDAMSFISGSDTIVQEWIDLRLPEVASKNNVDYLPELSRLFLEVLGFGVFDIRFESFYADELHSSSRTTKLLQSAFVTNSSVMKTDNGPKLWLKFETPIYRKLRKAQEYMESVAIDLLAFKMSTFNEKGIECPATLLEKYLSSTSLDFKDIIGIACDFLLAGMDTTTYTSSFLLYHLATNPKAQQVLYEESVRLLPNPDDPVTPEIYKEAEYAKCALKESLRLRPIAVGVGRVLTTDVVFSGYKVPNGTIVVTLNEVACRLEKYFLEPELYKPERWIKTDPAFQKTPNFLVTPFGHGQRSCIAKRFAEQNMVLLILKLVRNYELHWEGGVLDSKSLLINVPDSPILLRLEKR